MAVSVSIINTVYLPQRDKFHKKELNSESYFMRTDWYFSCYLGPQ